jgi:carbamoyl-phosphate synthase large subunit
VRERPMIHPDVRKVLVIGSGPIIIGQAAEFDYAGTQACKALREEGVTSVLVNSNPATIMTDPGVADVVYVEPLTVEVLDRIIARERPDGLLPTLGGQTGLNLAVELASAGVLERNDVRLLGTPLETIQKAEDRELFKQLLIAIGEPVPPSQTVHNLEEALELRKRMELPLIVRPAFTLGGTGGGIARTEEEYVRVASRGLQASPISQVLVERSVQGWKEIEYEVMRDAADTCITVCNMENVDPMGVHTGDSIVVAPSQTLTDKEYQLLRSSALKIIRALGIEGGCNVQFALDPKTSAYYVIEVNPRVSRSSALASKATGYPIARVAAKIAVGRRLREITNAVTGKTTAAFEPTLDYCVVKIPRWPFDKFPSGDRTLGTQMKATGEVMAIDRAFEPAFQKAVRSLEIGGRSLAWESPAWVGPMSDSLWHLIELPNDLRLWAITAALRRDVPPAEISARSGIDPWFVRRFQRLVDAERGLLTDPLTPDRLRAAKRLGFSDGQIGTLADRLPEQIRQLRHDWDIRPVYKMVDTCAAEFEAVTPYFYSTYDQENEAEPDERPRALVIGSGPIRIGQGIEFDYCSVHSAIALQQAGVRALLVNSNPETVSTDFDTSDRLYFEPLDEESIRDLLDNEGLDRTMVVTQFGGQTAINLAEPLERAAAQLIGSGVETIDLAEDRRRFEDFLARFGIPQPPGGAVTKVDDALVVASTIGYPVLVRPSYVLGGRAMEIVYSPDELVGYVANAAEVSLKRPILVDKYLVGREVEVDAICDGTDVLIPGIMEHIERAGVHSGDSIAVYPAQQLSPAHVAELIDYTVRIGRGLAARGLLNVQYVIHQGRIYVLEVNPRASRTVPFLSKVTGVPMVRVATWVALGRSLAGQGYSTGLWPAPDLVALKAPVFSMAKLMGVDTYLGPEMKSTGEVMGIDRTYRRALIKTLMASKMMLPNGGSILLSIADRDKLEALPLIQQLAVKGFAFYATEGTAAAIQGLGLGIAGVVKKIQQGHPNVVDLVEAGRVNALVNTATGIRTATQDGYADGFYIRRAATERGLPCFTSLDTLRAAVDSLDDGALGYAVAPLTTYVTARPSDAVDAPSKVSPA